jgi:hypothetical protein
MVDGITEHLPPLRGCLYCHSEDTTTLSDSRKWLGFGSDFPRLRCSHCNSVALLDYDTNDPEDWRIRYCRVNHASRYYYVALYLGRAGWLSAHEALEISTDGYVQRMRVAQAKAGDLAWLHSAHSALPMIGASEKVYLTLKAVTLQATPPPGLFVRAAQGAVLDSGKLYVTDQNLHLLGQRRNWSHALVDARKIDYDDAFWTIYFDTAGQLQHYHGSNAADQLDAQLVAAVTEALWRENST